MHVFDTFEFHIYLYAVLACLLFSITLKINTGKNSYSIVTMVLVTADNLKHQLSSDSE